jgi:hypothetical protein
MSSLALGRPYHFFESALRQKLALGIISALYWHDTACRRRADRDDRASLLLRAWAFKNMGHEDCCHRQLPSI